jgi:hypothetical protein
MYNTIKSDLDVSSPVFGSRGPANQQARNEQPSEPCTHQKADELLKLILDLEGEQARLNSFLFEPDAAPPDSSKGASSLDGKIAVACSRVAMMCGYLRSINNRLAG